MTCKVCYNTKARTRVRYIEYLDSPLSLRRDSVPVNAYFRITTCHCGRVKTIELATSEEYTGNSEVINTSIKETKHV